MRMRIAAPSLHVTRKTGH
uniref:Uncharacterized protein n=1 Tax=Arundo donax TaxID=35708 RepID=A0A0A9HEX2_ARUDO